MKISQQPASVDQAAKRLNVSAHTLRAWIAQRRIGVLRLGRRVMIPAEEIERLLQSAFTPADER